jgi:dTDP-L-rhamnose 4-epimerase
LFERPPIIFEDGRQIRDYVNIEDVVAANLTVLNDPAADMHVFNVGGGQAWSVTEFYERMQSLTGRSIAPVTSGLYRYGDTRHIFSDTGRLQRLGWSPRRSVDHSILAYWDYLGCQRDNPDVLAQAEQQMRRLNVIRRSNRPE